MKRYFLIFVLLLSACSAGNIEATDTPRPTKTPLPSETPVPTDTPAPTETRSPTNTPWPTKQGEGSEIGEDNQGECVIDNDFLLRLKAVVPYEEFTLTHNIIEGIHSLVVWYVDPEINNPTTFEELDVEQAGVIERATVLAVELYQVDHCVGLTFTHYNPIVVDEHYNGWFAGLLDSGEIDSAGGSADRLVDSYTQPYLLSFLPEAIENPPVGSCTWQETEEKIWQHFSRQRQNITFHYVYDLNGYNVWAQWDGPGMLFLNSAAIMNVVMELDCLYPAPDSVILITVDDAGGLVFLGVIFSNGGEVRFEDLQVLIGQ